MGNVKDFIEKQIASSISIKQEILEKPYIQIIEDIAKIIIAAYKTDNKVLLCGNGGSASDAQHIEGELVGRFKMERKGLPAIALTANTATITAIGNDYGYDDIFRRGVEAHGKAYDVLIAISTSGNSKNVVLSAEQAKKQNIKVVSFTGYTGGKLAELADISLIVPSSDTARIQECHIMVLHIICELVERGLFDE